MMSKWLNVSPLVSVVVCTYNRNNLLPRALESVLVQDEPDIEVIVVDDGSDEPVCLPLADDRLRLIRTEHGGPGAARATGLNAARGEFVAYCDDDDMWTPDHLRVLLRELRAHPEVALVYGDALIEEAGESRVQSGVDFDPHRLTQTPYIFASDVLHRTSAARDVGGFDVSLPAYEDWDLWLRMSERMSFRRVPVTLTVHGCPADRVSAREHPRVRFRLAQFHRRRKVYSSSSSRSHRLSQRPGVPAFDPDTWRPGRRQVIVQSPYAPEQSFGYVGRQLLLAMERQGLHPVMGLRSHHAPPDLDRFRKPPGAMTCLGLLLDYRRLPTAMRCERIIHYTMWESTLVPLDQIEEANRAVTLLYVPCRQNLEAYLARGLRVPAKVLHHGVDTLAFPYLRREHPDTFTFGTYGDLSPRKGIDVLIRAFQEEFTRGESVRLLMKATHTAGAYRQSDPRITVEEGFWDHERLLGFLGELDAFVLPSRGEGFGLCGLEAMATGLPLIATNWSGPVEYLDPNDSFPLAYRLVDAQGIESNAARYFGEWAEPDVEHLRSLMRWLYEHPAEAAMMGRRAAARVRAEWSWDRVGRQLVADLDAIARGITPAADG